MMHKYTFHAAARIHTVFAAVIAVVGLGASDAHAAASDVPTCINSHFADGHVVLHFDAPQHADHITLTTFNAPAKTIVRVSDGQHSVAIAASNSTTDYSDTFLRAPLQGTDFVVSVDNVSVSDEAVCITQVRLSQGLNQLEPSAQQSAADVDAEQAAELVGSWSSTVSNIAQTTLHIAADGSWQLQTSQGVRQGSWQWSDGQLQMRLGTSGAFVPMHIITQVVAHSPSDAMDAAAAKHTVLMLSDALIPELGGTFSNAAQP